MSGETEIGKLAHGAWGPFLSQKSGHWRSSGTVHGHGVWTTHIHPRMSIGSSKTETRLFNLKILVLGLSEFGFQANLHRKNYFLNY